MSKVLFINKRKKYITLTIAVDGTGDIIEDRKGMVDLQGQQYMSANKVAGYIIERDFERDKNDTT